jgi:molecular chaperone HtpG
MSTRMSQPFQVNLRGIIDLLSNHIYGDAHVYVRELLQNGVDALTARESFDGHRGSIRVSILRGDGPPELRFDDDGIGLTEQEVHQFLATLGESSKRRVQGSSEVAPDFLGQFGIGLFSCFLVADEIVVATRSARDPDARAVIWRGHHEGSYVVEGAPERAAGTTVILRARAGHEDTFEPQLVRAQLARYGALLRWPVHFHDGVRDERVDRADPPWRANASDAAVLAWGASALGQSFLDWIPLRSETGDADGVAFVLPHEPSLGSVRSHRVYLKGMLVTEESTDVLPPWAFFVHAIVDARRLRPNASRESLYADATLATTREELGASIREWLLRHARSEPDRVQRLLRVHHRAIKALSASDDDVLALFAAWLPFETSSGAMSAGEIASLGRAVWFTRSVDAFRQMSGLAQTQGRLLVNAGYAYDDECLSRAAELLGIELNELDPTALTQELDEVSEADLASAEPCLEAAARALEGVGCDVSLRSFRPDDLPAFYAIGAEATYRRSVERAAVKARGAWSDVLSAVKRTRAAEKPVLCFNHRSALVRRLIALDADEAIGPAVRLVYVHAMLLGHHPLSNAEHVMLPSAILDMIAWGLDGRGERILQ